MRKIKLKILVFFILVFIVKGQAQQSFAATGENVIDSGGEISYSVGQFASISQIGPNGSVSVGVLQPFEISVTLGLDEAKGIKLQCTVFPNPTTKNVTLLIENYNIANISYLIFDLNGRNITNNKISSNETFISMENLPATTYFIKIMNHNKELKTFKIIKRN